MSSKRGFLAWDTLLPWIIALAVLALMAALYATLYDKGEGGVSFIQNFLRFGR